MTGPVAIERPASTLDRARTVLRTRPFVVTIPIAVVPILLSVFVFAPRYESNDDATMNLLSAGLVYIDQPDEHLLFTNVLIGLALKSLYSRAPDVPWYGLYQLVTLTAAATAIVYALLRVNSSIRQGVVALLFVIVAVVPCVVELQFTKTAFLASFSGMLLLLAPLRAPVPLPRVCDVLGFALVIWGSLIRSESLFLALAMVAPVALAAAIATPVRAAWRAVPLALALAVCVALNQFNAEYYARGDGWQEFYASNALRAEFTDYGHYLYTPETSHAFHAAGWTEADYWMMCNWFLADRDRYSLTRMRQIAATVPRAPPRALATVADEIVQNLPRFPQWIVLMLAVPCAAMLQAEGWRSWILQVVLFVLPYALTLVLGAYFYLPFRIVFPLFAGALAAAALRPAREERGRAAAVDSISAEIASAPPGAVSSSRQEPGTGEATGSSGENTKKMQIAVQAFYSREAEFRSPESAKIEIAESGVRRMVRFGAGIAAVCLMIASLVFVARNEDVRARQDEGMKRVMKSLNPLPATLFVLWREWFPLEVLVNPLKDTRPLRNFRCLPMGVLAPTPFATQRMREFHISDVYEAICTRNDVFLVAIPSLLSLYAQYLLDHYNTPIEYRTILSTRHDPRFFGQDKTYVVEVFQVRRVGRDPAREPQQPRR
jgi:hypothetical protein